MGRIELGRIEIFAYVALIAAVLFGIGALALFLFRRWKARRARPPLPKRPRRPHYPIVLAHGFMGFDEIKLGETRLEYFRGVPARLRDLGAEVHVLRVNPIAGVERRGRELEQAIRRLGAKRVNIVAHSMGGLDARYAISRLGLSDKVLSVTTIGTPHRGTPLADMSSFVLDMLALPKVLAWMGLDMSALRNVTTANMEAFNLENVDHPEVAYGSVIATTGKLDETHPLLVPAHFYLLARSGANDGIVPADSQTWGETLGTVEADHWAQIGISKRFDAPDFYSGIVKELRGRGF